jgi:hypothetical protein
MWYLDTTRIYVTDIGGNYNQTIARLQPIASGTIMQYFGYESATVAIQCKVVGITNLDNLRHMRMSGTSYALTTPYDTGTHYPYAVNSIKWKLDKTVCQTLDTTQSGTVPVYTVDLELFYDGNE